jgi:hypothetical protein
MSFIIIKVKTMVYVKYKYFDFLELKTPFFKFYTYFTRYIEDYNLSKEDLEAYDYDLTVFNFENIRIEFQFYPLKHWKNIWDYFTEDCTYWGYKSYNLQTPWFFVSISSNTQEIE